MGWACRLMTQTRLDIEPGGVSELGHKLLTVESLIAFCCPWFFVAHRWATGEYNSGRCWTEGMVQGDWMVGTPRCTVYWLSHRAALCPRRTAIVPTHKGLIQHILSPREGSGNQRRWPSTPPNFSSYVPVSLSLCFYLPLLLSGLQHGSGHASKGSAEQCEGPDRNLTFFFFQTAEVCHILGGQSGPGAVGKKLTLSFFSLFITRKTWFLVL